MGAGGRHLVPEGLLIGHPPCSSGARGHVGWGTPGAAAAAVAVAAGEPRKCSSRQEREGLVPG